MEVGYRINQTIVLLSEEAFRKKHLIAKWN